MAKCRSRRGWVHSVCIVDSMVIVWLMVWDAVQFVVSLEKRNDMAAGLDIRFFNLGFLICTFVLLYFLFFLLSSTAIQ